MSGRVLCYAAVSRNDAVRRASSSGGTFSHIAEKMIENGGVVYGVAMARDCRSAEFVRASCVEELVSLRGSKYLPANAASVYVQVRADLEEGVPVLFSGTGCQVNGLKCYLGSDPDNLCCLDVLCHGVPSPALWRAYVQHVEDGNQEKLVAVEFRCKDDCWSEFGLKRTYANGSSACFSINEDPFMLMFLRDYCLRPSCYACVAKKRKLSDITLGDFWGIEAVAPEMNDERGTSLVIVRTEKGRKLYSAISDSVISREVTYEGGVRRNPAEHSSASIPAERSGFFFDLDELSFEELSMKYARPSSLSSVAKLKKALMKSKRKMRKIRL